MNITAHADSVPNRVRPFLFASIFGLVSCALLADRVCAQPQPVPANADSAMLPWLDVKPGCWEVRTQVTRVIKQGTLPTAPSVPSADEALQKRMAEMTPEQRALMTPDQQIQWKKQYEAMTAPLKNVVQQQAAMLAKGINTGPQTAMRCSASPFADARGAVYDAKAPAKHCTRTVADSGSVRHMRIDCNDFNGDFERIDAEHFKGTTQIWSPANEADATSDHPFVKDATAFTAKWISEAQPHLPYSPPMTDLDGVRPKGPYAVAWLDPFRLVAEIDGKQFIAQRAYLLINYAPPGIEQAYGTALPDIFQKIYMHLAVGAAAVQLHLDQQQPWKGRLTGTAGVYAFRNFDAERFTTYGNQWNQVVNRDTPGHDSSATIVRRDGLDIAPVVNILWDAYFNQYSTKAETDTALQQVKEKYKLTILDPDFFAGTRRD